MSSIPEGLINDLVNVLNVDGYSDETVGYLALIKTASDIALLLEKNNYIGAGIAKEEINKIPKDIFLKAIKSNKFQRYTMGVE